MTCPSIEQLEDFVEDWLDTEEENDIRAHFKQCRKCREMVSELEQENEELKEILKSPTVTDQFTDQIMRQIKPYEQEKRKKRTWHMPLLVASASLFLIGGVILSPSFAQWASGIFSTDDVDEGVQNAMQEGMGKEVNMTAVDRGITFKVDEFMMDPSRVVLSYQFLNGRGKAIPHYDVEYEVVLVDEHDQPLGDLASSWRNLDDYGLIELRLTDFELESEQVKVWLTMTEVNGLKGNWRIEIPMTAKDIQEHKEITVLKESAAKLQDTHIRFKSITKSPSMIIFDYEIGYPESSQNEVFDKIAQVKKQTGIDIESEFQFGHDLNYRVLNKEQETIYEHVTSLSTNAIYHHLLESSSDMIGEFEGAQFTDAYSTRKKGAPTYVELLGAERIIPATYSVEVDTKKLKSKPIDISYKGHQAEIQKVEKVVDYYARKSLIPIGKRTHLEIALSSSYSGPPAFLGKWLLEDEKGAFHETFFSGSSDDGTLFVYGLDEVPEKFRLHLVSELVYEEFAHPVELKLE